MEIVEPKVFLIAETKLDNEGLLEYLKDLNVLDYSWSAPSDSEALCEMMGRLCYRSFKPGLNPNVTKVRTGNDVYLKNIINTGHGSVLEHASVSFIFKDVSRVFTHELVRHRSGVAISQESLRFVRLDKLSAYVPIQIEENEEAMSLFMDTFDKLEEVQKQLADIYDIENTDDFARKKELTSAFRRVAPIGLATTIGWTCNMRALRHIIELRTSPHAEIELRVVFAKVFDIVKDKYPNIFGDYKVEMVDGIPWVHTTEEKI